MKDILLVMSDQHAWWATGFQDSRICTPQLERIGQEGTVFERCYCNAPLCVPSRMSFLTGQLPSEIGIFDNDAALPSDIPTIAHEMGILGYETVLVGRMHFKGADQNHGFDQRLCGDITSQYWGTGGKHRTDFGAYAGTTNRKHCLEAVGAGYSPVMAYDEQVFQEAMELLQSPWERENPLFMIVGFYGPHFPFVCGKEEYQKYQERFRIEECEALRGLPSNPIYKDYVQSCTPEHMRNCMAAYCGLVERLDGYVGALYDQFMKRPGEKVFFYTSDHGEQAGKRGIFGKQTMYEEAIHVPLIAVGTDVAKGINREPVSLLDLSRTLVELAGGQESDSWHHGKAIDLKSPDKKREPVRIQQMAEKDGKLILIQAVTDGKKKEIRACSESRFYEIGPCGEEQLLEKNGVRMPWEKNGTVFLKQEKEKALVERQYEWKENFRRLKHWGEQKRPDEPATRKNPENARKRPEE